MSNENVIDAEPLILRSLLWDMTPHEGAPDLAAKAGLIHSSEEGVVKEHRASHMRLARVESLIPAVTVVGRNASLVANLATLEDRDCFYIPLREFMESPYFVQMVMAILSASISVMVDIGVLRINEEAVR